MTLKVFCQKVSRRILLKLLHITQPSPLQNHLEQGSSYFFNNYMDPAFEYNKYQKQWNPYYLKYGIKEPMTETMYYSQKSGIESNLYMSRGMAFNVIYPYLTRISYIPAYADKNMEAKLLDIKKVQQDTDVMIPTPIIYNMSGIYFDADDNEISEEQAIAIVMSYNADMIIKPSSGTYGGQGVKKVYYKNGYSHEVVKELFTEYKQEFVIQELIEQHPDLAAFNPTSVNTVRIVTFRNSNKERRVLFSLLRFGGKGAINDNVCSGGGFCMLNKDSGCLTDRVKHVYHTLQKPLIDDSLPNKVPYYDKMVKAALRLHGQLPHFDICGWDFTVTPDGHPVMVEYNIRPGHGLQEGVGPFFTKDEMDEIMSHIKTRKEFYTIKGNIHYSDRPTFGF